MSKIRDLVIEAIQESNLEEGKFGKALGTLATAAMLGLGQGASQAASFNQGYKDKIIWSSNDEIPAWVQDAGTMKFEDDNITAVGEGIAPRTNDGYKRVGEMSVDEAMRLIISPLVDNVNRAVKGKLNPISTESFFIQGLERVSSHMQIEQHDGVDEIHEFTKEKINQDEMAELLVIGLKRTNPHLSEKQARDIIDDVMRAYKKSALLNK